MSVQIKGVGTIGGIDQGLNTVGVITATSFVGSGANLTSLPAANLTGTLPALAAPNLTSLPAANLTGTLPAISGANLTSLPTQVTLSNNADNRVITGGSGVNLNGEANLTFDGTELKIGGDSSVAGTFGLEVYNTASNEGTALIAGTQGARLDIMDTGSSERIRISASGAIYFISYKSGDDIIFQNTTGSGTAERFRVKTDGIKVTSVNAHGSAIQMYNTDSSSNVWYVNGEGDYFTGNSYPRSDANKDLGFHSGHRWRDLVLSGGVRFGSANAVDYLDDYEEGSWNPTYVTQGGNLGSVTYTNQYGYYVKIAHTVWVMIDITIASASGMSGNPCIGNHPFNSDIRHGQGNYYSGTSNWYIQNHSNSKPIFTGWMPSGSNIFRMHNGDHWGSVPNAPLNTTGRLSFSHWYTTNS